MIGFELESLCGSDIVAQDLVTIGKNAFDTRQSHAGHQQIQRAKHQGQPDQLVCESGIVKGWKHAAVMVSTMGFGS